MTGMKAVMYHYVRPESDGYPFFRYLSRDDFRSQVKYFKENLGLVSREDFFSSIETGNPCPGVVLTFDDGLKDHLNFVLPVLEDFGAWGLFFFPTSPLISGKVLDVHRIHHLLGRHGGDAILDALKKILISDMLVDGDQKAFGNVTYQGQTNDKATTEVKRVLNYLVSYDHRGNLLDELERTFPGAVPAARDFYLTGFELQKMAEAGMVIGSHSVSHRVFSKLEVGEQAIEIADSFAALGAHLPAGHPQCFCYPYGGRHTFGRETEDLLHKAGSLFSFCVDPRDINSDDLKNHPQALPRFDCNQFPHGKASMG